MVTTRKEKTKKASSTIKRSLDKIARDKSLEKLKTKIQSRYLKAICSDSGACISLGKERTKIKNFFNGYTDFSLVNKECQRIGEKSSNGFIFEIPFEKEGYHSYSIIKSTSFGDRNSIVDNLIYEWFVGMHLNIIGNFFPCLIETYNLFRYKDQDSYRTASNSQSITNLDEFIEFIDYRDVNIDHLIEDSCLHQEQFCIMIQHLNNVKSINDIIYPKNENDKYKIDDDEMIFTLFNVYYFLHYANSPIHRFTHYDLHGGNVLLYKPHDNKKIKYVFLIEDGEEVTFESSFLPKIIDYGRCYVRTQSEDIRRRICEIPTCNYTIKEGENTYEVNCGDMHGYAWLNNINPNNSFQQERSGEENDFISSLYPNISHDLRLYNIVQRFGNNRHLKTMKPCVYSNQYGTAPIHKNMDPTVIANVSDCYYDLLNKVKEITGMQSKSISSNLIATINVYNNEKPMSTTYHHYQM